MAEGSTSSDESSSKHSGATVTEASVQEGLSHLPLFPMSVCDWVIQQQLYTDKSQAAQDPVAVAKKLPNEKADAEKVSSSLDTDSQEETLDAKDVDLTTLAIASSSSDTTGSSSKQQSADPCNLYVNKLPDELGERALFNLFRSYGRVLSVKIYIDLEANKSKGYGTNYSKRQAFFVIRFCALCRSTERSMCYQGHAWSEAGQKKIKRKTCKMYR
ncbi:unnamed protein product [Hydatigera taeniaeformis]|uniref:RRM domain-containing protein n=1 Tax=Hydatigena taeniaeformis TaxID=6205 RepID=A0A0R3WTL2_HYDTA|nr:unnamed protein product [Hydatigera taeniaeformis]